MMQLNVAICTFRRASVIDAIDGIAAQSLPPGYRLHLIIADNDDTPDARSLIVEHAGSLGLDATYIHAPARNISIARNACLAAARGRWLAFHDDDGVAAPDWIAKIMERSEGAHVVFGTALAAYSETAPDWMREGDFHSVRYDGPRGGYAGNTLIDMDFVRLHRLAFDEALGRTGGEDTFFFFRVHQLGGVLRFAPEAIVVEPVPAARATLGWILKRRYRYGQVHGRLTEHFEPKVFRLLPVSALIKTVVCAGAAVVTVFSARRCVSWLVRGALHVGALSYCLNRRVREDYA